ncbi:hypothetical protein [Pseudonocardia acaciae]|uniref:hypothetical protein n=1 Tax=Pseudonocardia acaciae TaxID=551276 RepID=UPI000491E19B|nr:hypothetical protein [Pseudonocardia acaciae]
MAVTWLNRLALAVLDAAPRRMWGFSPRLMPVLAERLGPARSSAWFMSNMPRYQRTLKAFGPLRTHVLATAISLRNGCRYCTLGHATALELIYLRDRDKLFPLDENAIAELGGMEPDELRRRLGDALRQAGLEEELPWLDRLFELAANERTPDGGPDDARLAHLIDMFAVLNACGIAGNVEPDQTHDEINKDTALKERYSRLRAESNA